MKSKFKRITSNNFSVTQSPAWDFVLACVMEKAQKKEDIQQNIPFGGVYKIRKVIY